MNSDDIKNIIKSFLYKNFIYDKNITFGDNESLTKSGFIDSIGIIEFIDYISSEFKIEIPDEYLTPENLDTIDSVVKLITKLKNDN